MKCFGLDRITSLTITDRKFSPPDFDVEAYYRYCFGIISPDDTQPYDIVLSFDPFQGKYIKTLPLHATQQILEDNEDELLIQLKLHITHDLKMELLSFGNNVKVLQPASLADEIKEMHREGYEQY